MYLLYNSFGFTGIYVLTLIISSLIAVMIFNILIKNKHGIVISFILSLIAVYLSKAVWAARNQIFSFLIFELELYSLHELLENGKKKYFFVILLLAFLLVQFHDTVYPLFFVMMLPYLAEIILSKIFKLDESNKLEYSNLKNGKYLVILMILSVVVGLFTPLFGTAYTNLVNCMNGFSTVFINELQPVYLFDNYALTFFAFSTIAILSFTKTKVKVKDLLFTLGFLIFSLIVGRNMFFMFLIGIIFWANIVRDFLNTYTTEKDILSKLDNSKMLVTVLSSFISIMALTRFSLMLTKQYVHDYTYPKDATEWILKYVDYENMRIFNSFNWGSYLELNGIKVFVDSRSGMYTEEENAGCTVLSDWYSVWSGSKDYEEMFDYYDITHILIENNEALNKELSEDENYEMIYQDNAFSLYERLNSN